MKRSLARAAPLAAAAFCAALVFGLAGAQPSSEAELRQAFATADVNGDGFIDVNEFVGHTIYIFKMIDKDRDGSITVTELIAWNPGSNPDRFKAADRNGDGKISLGEAVAVKMIEFFEIDTNRDGVITVEELIVYERSLPPVKK